METEASRGVLPSAGFLATAPLLLQNVSQAGPAGGTMMYDHVPSPHEQHLLPQPITGSLPWPHGEERSPPPPEWKRTLARTERRYALENSLTSNPLLTPDFRVRKPLRLPRGWTQECGRGREVDSQ